MESRTCIEEDYGIRNPGATACSRHSDASNAPSSIHAGRGHGINEPLRSVRHAITAPSIQPVCSDEHECDGRYADDAAAHATVVSSPGGSPTVHRKRQRSDIRSSSPVMGEDDLVSIDDFCKEFHLNDQIREGLKNCSSRSVMISLLLLRRMSRMLALPLCRGAVLGGHIKVS